MGKNGLGMKKKAKHKYKMSMPLQAVPQPGKIEWKKSKGFLSLIHIL